MKICVIKSDGQIIESEYKIYSKEQAAYEAIMAGSDLQKILFFILAKDFDWDVINFVIQNWKDKKIWKMAFRFVEKLGYGNAINYNAGILPEWYLRGII